MKKIEISEERRNRFLLKINKEGGYPQGDPTYQSLGQCHLWLGGVDKWGYGKCHLGSKTWIAHRLSYTIFKGVIPDGMMILHKCDNPRCVNPDHLSAGSNADNTRDKMQRRRHQIHTNPDCIRGANNGATKLTTEDVREVRRMREAGVSLSKIGARFGVRMHTIQKLLKGVTWRHVV